MRSKLVAILALGVLVSGASTIAPHADAQPVPTAAPKAKQRIVIDRASVKPVTVMAAITHTPFPIIDPHTKQPVAPTTIIKGLRGEPVRAGDYWGNVNKFEQYLNARGLTLRGAPKVTNMERLHEDDAISKARTTRFQSLQHPVTPAVLAFQASRRVAPSSAFYEKHRNLAATHMALHKPGKAATEALNANAVVEKTVSQSWPVELPVGGDKFGADFGSDVRIDSRPGMKSVATRAKVDGTVFGNAFTILEGHVKSVSHLPDLSNGHADADIEMTVFGDDAFPKQHLSGTPGKPELFADRRTVYSHTFSPDFPSVNIGVGPFSVDMVISQAAHTEMDVAVKVASGFVRADVIPSSSLDISVRASVGIPGVELGVDGKLRVFANTTDLGNQVELSDAGPDTKLVVTNEIVDHLDYLHGSMKAFAKIGICPFCDEFDLTIFSSAGGHEEPLSLSTNLTIELIAAPPPPPPPPPPKNAGLSKPNDAPPKNAGTEAPVKPPPPTPRGGMQGPRH